jgi:GTP cyclohydrolase I
MTHISPKGVLVMIQAEHMCMTMRGIKKPGSKTVTIARRGVFNDDPVFEERFFHMMGQL